MKDTLSTSEVAHRLMEDESAGWSYDGACALAEYLESMEEGTGEEMELDVVAIRCDFDEYSTAKEAAEACGYEPDEDDDEEDQERHALKWLNNHTTVIEFDGGVIIQAF